MSFKTCARCEIPKPLESFYVHNRKTGARYTICKACHCKYFKQRRKNPDYIRKKKQYYLDNRVQICANKYGITEAEVRLLHKKKCCQLCEKVFQDGQRSRYIDHCHETGIVRGILCSTCNQALGMLGDTVVSLQRALNYVKGAS